MLRCTVKFCGGLQPAPRSRRMPIEHCALRPFGRRLSSPYPEEGAHYDALLIIRGCTGSPYLYEDIEADRRVLSSRRADEIQSAIDGDPRCRVAFRRINGGNIGRRRFSFPLPRPGLH